MTPIIHRSKYEISAEQSYFIIQFYIASIQALLNTVSTTMSSENPFVRAQRARKHNYRLLNDGSDDEADIEDRMEEPVAKRSQAISSLENESIEYAIYPI